ncbi:MAG: NAD(P)-dependent oxidoreductase [Chloroflexi bacterium]|nr:NAD(P)-dependent oxidoreductase [Chloroflexota bacterium]
MRIAITGGSGRVGRATLQLVLSEGHSAVNLDQHPMPEGEDYPGVPFVQLKLADYEAVEQALQGCDAVIHLAAIPSPNRHPEHVVHNNNVVGSYNVLLAAAKLGIKKVCQASSVNATGLVYSRQPHFDYFPLDEKHPTYNEDPYSLSKWICELQGDSIARRYEDMTISSLRFSGLTTAPVTPISEVSNRNQVHNLWAYTNLYAVTRACLAALSADFKGHEVFYIVAPQTYATIPSPELAREFYPDVPLRPGFGDHQGFFDSSKAERLLGWKHDI